MSGRLRADCVIVGGGPAGSTTALLLARSGFDVVLLEHREFPRGKPCGDCLSPQANLLLAELGVLPAVLAQSPAQLAGWRIHGPTGSSFTARFRDWTTDTRVHHGISLSRDRLDAVLLDAARQAGVRVLTGVRVEQVLNGADTVRGISGRQDREAPLEVLAALTIGADGLRSVVRRRLGLSARSPILRKLALSAHVDGVTDLTDLGELYLQDGSCIGIAPVDAAAKRCNLTLVVDADRYGRLLAGKTMSAFRAQLERFPGLNARLPREFEGQLLASGPFDRPTRRTVVNGAALVGDAAGYFDPFTGQGIYQALAGARLLATHAARALHARRTDQPLFKYARAQRALVRDTVRLQHAIEAVCAHPFLAERCIRALSRAPAAAQALVAVTGDLARPASLLSPAIATSFLLGLTKRSNPS